MIKLLIVEDEKPISDLMVMNLTRAGYSCTPLYNGKDAADLLEANQSFDLILLDIKHIDPDEHRKLTGHDNANILDCAKYLSDIDKPVWIRHVLVPGITDVDEYLDKTAEFIHTLKNVKRVDVLPYHTLGVHKWKELGIPYQLDDVDSPTEERLAHAKRGLGDEH